MKSQRKSQRKNQMKRVTAILPLVTALATLLLLSCSAQPCYEDTDPLMHTRLLLSGTGEQAVADSLRVWSVTGSDTLLFVNSTRVNRFSLPLDPSHDHSTFMITLNGITDTAVVQYDRKPYLVSPACGYTMVSELTGVMSTHNIIDTVIIENKSVNLNGHQNLHLFYQPAAGR